MTVHTESVRIADLSPPTADQIDTILGHIGHLRIPLPNQIDIFFDLIGLDLMEDDRVHVLTAGQDFGERALHIFIHLSALGCAINQVR